MNEMHGKRQEEQRCWAGLDWGSQTHAVSVVNDAREVVGRFKVEASLKGLEQLVKRLGGFGMVAGIAVEATRNPVVNYLASAGFTVYPRLYERQKAYMPRQNRRVFRQRQECLLPPLPCG